MVKSRKNKRAGVLGRAHTSSKPVNPVQNYVGFVPVSLERAVGIDPITNASDASSYWHVVTDLTLVL